MMFYNRLVAGALALAAFTSAAFPADTSGTILGTVKDPAGNLIPHATAVLTNKATGVKQAAPGDDRGAFGDS
jgi:hypothetical protein